MTFPIELMKGNRHDCLPLIHVTRFYVYEDKPINDKDHDYITHITSPLPQVAQYASGSEGECLTKMR